MAMYAFGRRISRALLELGRWGLYFSSCSRSAWQEYLRSDKVPCQSFAIYFRSSQSLVYVHQLINSINVPGYLIDVQRSPSQR